MAEAFMKKDYQVISGGTDNHMMLIDLRNKNISGKEAEEALGKADITVNKNMVPFDDKSPFVTSGIRVGTPAVTTRGLKEADMDTVVDLVDRVITNYQDEDQAECSERRCAGPNARQTIISNVALADQVLTLASSAAVKVLNNSCLRFQKWDF